MVEIWKVHCIYQKNSLWFNLQIEQDFFFWSGCWSSHMTRKQETWLRNIMVDGVTLTPYLPVMSIRKLWEFLWISCPGHAGCKKIREFVWIYCEVKQACVNRKYMWIYCPDHAIVWNEMRQFVWTSVRSMQIENICNLLSRPCNSV